MTAAPLPTRPLGSTGRAVTTFGLGGEGVLRTHGENAAARAVIATAVARGVSCPLSPDFGGKGGLSRKRSASNGAEEKAA